MDLTWLKWLVIIALIFGIGWAVTDGGINYAYKKATSGEIGVNPDVDQTKETTLTRYAGFLLATFRYEKAKKFYTAAITNFPAGKNRYWNRYQLARCEEKLKNWQNAADVLYQLHQVDANQYDHRVPNQATLKLRIEKLVQVHDLADPFDPLSAQFR